MTHRPIEADSGDMRPAFALAALVSICAHAAAAQVLSEADAHRLMDEIQAGNIQANVPDEPAFSRLLRRDLAAYFAGRGFQRPVVSFEMLRRGPTQSGIAYPKFYLWVRVRDSDGRLASGAVRVAAVQRQRFLVGDFLSAPEIKTDPNRVGAIFPAPLVQAIVDRAASPSPPVG